MNATKVLARLSVWSMPGLLVGCVETSPLDYREKDAAGAPSDAALNSQCTACLSDETTDCGAKYQACLADPSCAVAMPCLVETGCLQLTQLQDRITCGTGCILKAGIVEQSNPAVTLIPPLNACTSSGGECALACTGQP